MSDTIPTCFENQLRKMRNVVYVKRAYKPDSCLDDEVIAYNVPEEVYSFLENCSSVSGSKPKALFGGILFKFPPGTVQLIPHFMIWITNRVELMFPNDVEKLIAVQKHCL